MPSGTNNFDRIQDTTQLSVTLGNIDSGDINEPYNYLDWRQRAGSISPAKLFAAYNQYLRNWYNKRNVVRSVPSTHVLKQSYISLLKQLTLSYKSTEEQQFLSNIDYDNDVDLAIAIPYFARQLKQVIVYLSTKRETVKATKLKYAMAGTRQAVERILYQHLLTAFTKKKYAARIYDPEFYASLPSLSAVNSFLHIQVQELFDESNYFDSDTTVPLSAYSAGNDFEFVNALLTSTVMEQLADTRNYSASATDIYEKYLGTQHYSVSADSDGITTETLVIDPITPYSHLDNRYFPTVAAIPNIAAVKPQSEIGGFFTYKNLGVSTYLAATKIYSYDVDNMAANVAYTIPDPLYINHGRSLTLTDQTAIVLHKKNLDWIKSNNTSEYQEGTIVDARTVQKFVPYQTKYETVGTDTQGTARTTDRFDFWTGEYSDVWSEQNTFPLNWRGEFNADARVEQLQVTTNKLHNWATDIFGNHYSIYKDYTPSLSADSIGVYEKKTRMGEVWVRTANNGIFEAPAALDDIYDKYATINNSIYTALTNNEVRNFDVVFDTLIFEIDNYVLVEHVDYDYELGTITQGAGGGTIISLSANNNYGGFWFNEEERTLVFTVLTSTVSGANDVIYPKLYKVDIATNISTQIFPSADTDLSAFMIPIDIIVTSWERPVMSYNKETKVYSISFLTHDDIRIHTMNIVETSKYRCQLHGTPFIHVLQD